MKKNKKIAFTGGATGGHITPIISLYNHLWVDGKYEYMWLGERESLEETAALENDIEFHDISAGKIRRYFDIRNFYEPLKNFTWVFESLYYLLKYKGDVVFSKGGFVSVPACIAAFILRKKIYIHESDSVMGLANKITSKLATKVFYSFSNELTAIENNKHIHCWAIVNPEMLDSIKSIDKTENERLTVLVIAGSQWSEKIFENLSQILPDCSDIDFNVILGTNDNAEIKAKLDEFKNVTTHGFLSQKKLAKLYIASDIAITRGSSTLWELFYFGIHSIIVPMKATGGNHQYHNGVYFNENYGSDVLDEDGNLHLEMFRRLQKYKDLRKTGLNLEGYLDGLKTIQEEIAS
jgi:UDP-N-acetylglucosamine--N-acetylmuramyl-(pentapeptide) pyrophosphoryl-undecaprenol N-acetylglucosamine transferase